MPGVRGLPAVTMTTSESAVAANGAGFVFSPLLGVVVYERVGMNAPLFVALALLSAMFVFALMSRRLRNAIVAEAPSEPTTP